MNNCKAKSFHLPVASWGNWLSVFLFLFILCQNVLVNAAPIALINENTTKLNLDNYVDILDNANSSITIHKLLNSSLIHEFAPIDLSSQTALETISPFFWLRFSINNSSDHEQFFWLTANHTAIESLTLYQSTSENTSSFQKTKDTLLKDNELSTIIKEVMIPAHSSTTFLLDIHAITRNSLKIELIKPQEFLPEKISRSRHFNFGLGILVMLALVNLFVALFQKSTLFLFHSCFLLSCIGIETAGLGIPITWFKNFGEWQVTAIACLLYLATSAALMCTLEYIKNSSQHNRFYNYLIYAQYGNTLYSLFIIIFITAYTPLMLVPFILSLPVILSSLFFYYKNYHDNIAFWIGILLTSCIAIFTFSLFTITSIFLVDMFTDPLLLALIIIETTITTALFVARERKLINDVITKKQIIDAHKTKHRAQNDLMQEFSRDMQTPLSGILGMADLLKLSSMTAEQHGKVDTIKNSGQALLNKISDIYFRIQLDNSSETVRKSPFELILLMENCVNSFLLPAETNNIELILQIQPDIPAIVKGDEYRLRQIIIQLMQNAIENTQQGEVLVKLSKNASDPDAIEFSIEDTGRGISEDHISALRKSIQKSSSDDNELGINTVKQLLSQLKSALSIASKEGEGSKFRFSLDLPAVETIHDKGSRPDAILKNKRLLIVDDNHTSCKILKQQANTWGMRAAEAYTGNEALAMYRAKNNLGETFDAIILDYDMPQVSGIEVAEKISLEAEKKPIIIMLTGLSESPPTHIVQQAGIDTVLNKPASQKLLQLTLCNLFQIAQKNNTPKTVTSQKLRLLVADDNDVIRSVISKMLDNMNIEYKMVSDGKLALDATKKERFDVILMDCEMPFMNGFEATEHIHQWQREKHQKQTPVIALTAYTLGEHKTKSIAAGMIDYLEKPINMTELEAVLQRHHVTDDNH